MKSKINYDGWFNLLASMGRGKDRQTNTQVSAVGFIDYITLEVMYRDNGFARKVIDIPANEMTREWIEIQNDPGMEALKKLKKLKAKKKFKQFLSWGGLYGGAVMVMGIDDGGDLEQPVNENGIRDIYFLRVYDRHNVSWSIADIDNDPMSEHYGLPSVYTINAYTTGNSFRVHRSRLLFNYGNEIPERNRVANSGWGDSMLQSVFTQLRDLGIVNSAGVSITQDFIQTMMQIENLAELIAAGKEDLVQKRLEIIDLSRSINNTILLDKEEQFTKISSSVTGLPELIGNYALNLSAVTGIPLTKLFGRAPAGLNATGESDIRNFYDDISSKQEDVLKEPIQTLVRYIMLSKDGGYGGKINQDAALEFKPLWQMDEKEDAIWKKTIAETDNIYINNGVLSPEEVAISRFESGFNPDTVIDINNRPTAPYDEPASE